MRAVSSGTGRTRAAGEATWATSGQESHPTQWPITRLPISPTVSDRLRNNSQHLSWPDDLRKMHSGSLPGSGPPSGNRLWHREYLSLLSRCPDGRMLEVGQTSVRHGRSEKGRGGEGSDGTLVGR